jgi:DnaJ-class molecular chaperone
MINPWKILGVSRAHTESEVLIAYRKLAQDTHPDYGGGSIEKFKLINEANSILKDRKRKEQFMAEIDVMYRRCAMCEGAGARFKHTGFLGRIAYPCETCEGAGVLIKTK